MKKVIWCIYIKESQEYEEEVEGESYSIVRNQYAL